MKKNVRKTWRILLLFLSFSLPVSAELKPFVQSSLNTIEKNYTNQAFLLVLWSIDCAPCRVELVLLGEMKKQYPDMNLVLLVTDDISKQKQVKQILSGANLQGVDSWAFADSHVAKLRFAIDQQWYGEIPRNYFYDNKHQRQVVSGSLNQDMLENWLKQNTN